MQRHGRPTAEGMAFWNTERLWRLASALPVITIEIAGIAEFDENCWFRNGPPTCRQVAEHARKIFDADLSFPVILSSDGRLMDGGHRIARAWLQGLTVVTAQRFVDDPEPDYVEPNAS